MRIRGRGRLLGCRRGSPNVSAGGGTSAGGRTRALYNPALVPRPEPCSVPRRAISGLPRGRRPAGGTCRGRNGGRLASCPDGAGAGRGSRAREAPQQRSHPLPQVVRNKISAHPDTLPTVTANGKTRISTSSRKASGGELAGRESDQLSCGGTQAWCRRIMCIAVREGVSRIAVFRRATASGWESCWPIRPACRAARATAWLRGRRSAS